MSDRILSDRHVESLIESAEASIVFHRTDLLAGIAGKLSAQPGLGQIIGSYYECVAQRREGQVNGARAGLEPVIAEAPARIRARALLTLARSHYDQGEVWEAAPFYQKAAEAARGVDPVTLVGSQKMLAVLASLRGQHRAALELLESLWPVAQTVRTSRPDEYLEYLNTLACTLAATGHQEAAQRLIARVVASPLVEFNRHWNESAEEISATPAPTLMFVVDRKPDVQAQKQPRRRKPDQFNFFIPRLPLRIQVKVGPCLESHRKLNLQTITSPTRAPPTAIP